MMNNNQDIINNLQLNIIYSSRKSIAIELKPDSILVRAPRGMSRRDINAFLNEKQPWIEKNLAKMQEREAALEELPLFTMDEIHELADKAMVVIPEKVRKYASMVGVTYGRITIRNQRSRWGSCSDESFCTVLCRSRASVPGIPQMPEMAEGKRWTIY